MTPTQKFDVIVVGAGFAGMYALYRLRESGLAVRVIEAAGDVGGTWYWNQYPGARCDVPSVEYSYSFSRELEQEWDWTEVMAAQPEIREYANHVADRFDLRKDISFGTRVISATWDENHNHWQIDTDSGEQYIARYCVMATGCLSVPFYPDIPGREYFEGPVYHTGHWPDETVDLGDKHVAVIGTGSSGVQAIPVIAEQAKQLTVFQRTPVYTFPAHNRPLDPDYREEVKRHYDEIRATQRDSLIGISGWGVIGGQQSRQTRNILETTEAERLASVDHHGLGAIGAYADIRTNIEANEIACDLYRKKLSELIDDPEVARKLMPRDYPIGCKRQVFDTEYYETFNRDNVHLVDLRDAPIEEITSHGLRTTRQDYEFDVLIYATGFDAMTGALNRIQIKGRDSELLKDKWAEGPRAYLGLQSAGFPNLFTITGPGSPSVLSNMIVSIEQHVEWIDDCIGYLQANDFAAIEPSVEAENAWIEHVNEVASGTIFTAPTCNSWYLGANVPGKPRIFMPYVGGVGTYRQKCEEIAANGYEGFVLYRGGSG